MLFEVMHVLHWKARSPFKARMDPKRKVYIWDMDETLILLKSLLNGSYAGAYSGMKHVENGAKIGKLWENHILQVCDRHFFYKQVENINQPYLDILNEDDDGVDLSDYNFNADGFCLPLDASNKRKLAYRHRAIAGKYRKGLYGILSQDLIKLWDNLYDLTDTYTDKWLSSARSFLEECASKRRDAYPSNSDSARGDEFQHVNVLVTSGPLIPSLVKSLFFRLDKVIACSNVYSSLEVGKLQCFMWIKERFGGGPNVQFCVIGDGWEECEAAQSMRWPFVQIDLQPNSIHRFPGLTQEDLQHYFSIIYGAEEEDYNNSVVV